MSPYKVFGMVAGNGASPSSTTDGPELPLAELSLSFVPLALVAEWTRCSETADFVARFFSHDFDDRDIAGSVLSTVVNELVENVAKFASDKSEPARLTVREYADAIRIETSNRATPAAADAFGETVRRITARDPEELFAEQIAHPPETGSAGIGLIMLRKDYSATIGARIASPDASGHATIDVEVTIDNREVGQP